MLWAMRDTDSQRCCGINSKRDAGRLGLIIWQDHPSPLIASPLTISDAERVSVVRCNRQRERSIAVGAGRGTVAPVARTETGARDEKTLAAHAPRQNQLALDRQFA